MKNQTLKMKLGLGLILAVALIAGYYGCGGSSSSDSGSSAVLYSTGVLDTTFGGDGVITTSIVSGDDLVHALALQPDGKILTAGYAWNGADYDFALARYNTNGSRDTTFDTDCVVTTTITSNDDDNAYALALQTDGRIVVGGYATYGSSLFALTRYNANGSLDTAFDTDGIVTTTIGSNNADIYAMVLQTDGKILAAGYADNPLDSDFCVARYNADGSLDTAFDADGIVTTTIGSDTDQAYALALQTDGRIVAAGFSYNGSNSDFALARYNTNGSLDTAFGGDGTVTTTIGTAGDYIYALAVQPDNKIVVAGYTNNGTNTYFALARYTATGTLDTTFGGDGVITTSVGVNYDIGRGIALQADGKILLAGYTWNGSINEFALLRYNADGTLDTSFGNGDGIVTTAAGSADNACFAIALQADRKIIIGGSLSNGGSNDFAVLRYWR